jgi:hypothetical protein
MPYYNASLVGNSSSVIMTTMSTLSPSSMDSDPCGTTFDKRCSDIANSDGSDEAVWMVLWVTALIIFLCLPFCITESRRDVCWRRIKERRWISYVEEDDWYTAAVRRQQEERRQQVEEQHRRYRTTRTHDDEIREQYLLQCMENYTIVRHLNECKK